MIYETFLSCLGANFIQSGALYWIKPIIKTQHVYGGDLLSSFNNLKNKSSSLSRFYCGFTPALLKSSIGRTADISLYRTFENKYNLSQEKSSLLGGTLSTFVKVFIMPLDTISNVYQVHGDKGKLHMKGNLYRGLLAYGSIHCISSTTWLLSYSHLKNHNYFSNENLNLLSRGFLCSLITDIIVNPIRVIKTNKQSFSTRQSYLTLIRDIYSNSGFYRGFATRIIYNAVNGGLFVLFWRNLEKEFMIMKKGK